MPRSTTDALERASLLADARTCEGKSPKERVAMLRDLLATVDAIWRHLSPEERARRRRIYDELHAAPRPWWKNVRVDALPPP